MPVEVLKEMLDRLPGVGIYNYYGQTELAPYHTILKSEDALTKLGSAGMGGLNMETRLEDEDRPVHRHCRRPPVRSVARAPMP